MRPFSLFVMFSVFIQYGCNGPGSDSMEDKYYLELVDTLRIDLMYEFGFVTKSAVDGYMLAYTYQDGVFHLINMSGEVEYSIDRRGEGPGEYSRNLPFATIFGGNLVFMGLRNLNFYGFNGDWIKSIPYNNPAGVGSIGIPDAGLLFLDSGRFVVPNQNIVDLTTIPGHLALLDTIPLWVEYRFSKATGQYERSDVGLMDITGVLYSKLKYPDYKSMIWFQDGYLWQIPQISGIVHRYGIGRSLYPLDKKSLEIPGFKEPVGLEFASRTVDNYKLFNKISTINSFINYVVPMDNGGFFAIYSTGVTEHEYNTATEDVNDLHGRFYGFYFDGARSKGYSMPLPENDMRPSFWKKVSYLGGDKFLFVFDNPVERDYYLGGVFSLKEK